MAFKQTTPLDMTGLEILNARAQSIAGAPGAPVAGQFWYNTVSGRIEFRGAAANIDPTARANHTGTQLAATVSDFDAQVRLSRLDQMAAPTAAVSAGSQKITNLATATVGTDAVCKTQLDAVSASIVTTRLDQFAAPTASVNLNSQKIIGLLAGVSGTDAVNKTQLDAVTTSIVTTRLDQFAAPTAPVSLNSQKITNLASGTAASDACTYGQLTNAVNGTDWKGSVRAASTVNVALTGLPTLDGITLIANERALLKNQTAPAENGIWTVASGAWTRAVDAAAGMLSAGAAVFVEEGSTLADTQWRLTTDGAITVGTTGQTWAQIGGSTSYTNGTGITLTGNVFAIDPATVVKKYATTVGDGAAISIAVTHNLGTTDVTVGVFEVTGGAEIGCDKVRTSTSVVTLGFAVAPALNTLRVVVHA